MVSENMEIRYIQPEEYRQQGIFAADNFFGSPTWMDAQGKGCKSFAIFKGGDMVAAFHLYHYSRLGKQFLINPPMAPHCGFMAKLAGEKIYSRQSEIKRMLTAMAHFLKTEYKGAFFDFSFPPEVVDVQPFQWKGFHTAPRYTYLLPLQSTEEQLLKQMSTERRKNIKNALAVGYEISTAAHQVAVAALVEQSLKKAGAPFKHELLNQLLTDTENEVFSVLVSKDGIPLATAVTVHDTRRAYYIAGGHSAEGGDTLAGTLSLWTCIEEAQLWGCREFDFLGSSVPAIEKYFRGFGGKLSPYFGIQSGPGLVGWLQKQKHKIKAAR
jgi:hypothetical protein